MSDRDDDSPVSVRLPPDLISELDAIVRAEERSRTWAIRRAIAEWVARRRAEVAP